MPIATNSGMLRQLGMSRGILVGGVAVDSFLRSVEYRMFCLLVTSRPIADTDAVPRAACFALPLRTALLPNGPIRQRRTPATMLVIFPLVPVRRYGCRLGYSQQNRSGLYIDWKPRLRRSR